MPMILFEVIEMLTALALLLLLITQVVMPLLAPSITGPNVLWAFRKKTTQNEMDNLRQKLAENATERQARILRERLESEQENVRRPRSATHKAKKPVTPKTATAHPEGDGEPTSLAM